MSCQRTQLENQPPYKSDLEHIVRKRGLSRLPATTDTRLLNAQQASSGPLHRADLRLQRRAREEIAHKDGRHPLILQLRLTNEAAVAAIGPALVDDPLRAGSHDPPDQMQRHGGR